MTESKALEILERMPEKEFQVFFETLPARVKLLCKGGAVGWRDVLPKWYVKQLFVVEPAEEINIDDIPF